MQDKQILDVMSRAQLELMRHLTTANSYYSHCKQIKPLEISVVVKLLVEAQTTSYYCAPTLFCSDQEDTTGSTVTADQLFLVLV